MFVSLFLTHQYDNLQFHPCYCEGHYFILSRAEQYSIIYRYHIFSIHLSVDGNLDCFQVLAIVNEHRGTCIFWNYSFVQIYDRSQIAGSYGNFGIQYSWACLVAWMVKSPPPMQETWIRSLGWKDPLARGVATHSSILAQRIPMERGEWQATVHGVTKRQTQLSD